MKLPQPNQFGVRVLRYTHAGKPCAYHCRGAAKMLAAMRRVVAGKLPGKY